MLSNVSSNASLLELRSDQNMTDRLESIAVVGISLKDPLGGNLARRVLGHAGGKEMYND